MTRSLRFAAPLVTGSVALWSALVGADGCRAVSSTTPAPDLAGAWAVTYASTFDVEVTIGGAHYTATVPETGGMVHVDHAGGGFDFQIDCARPEVVCPSEVWPERVTIDQRDATYEHRMWVTIPSQTCSVALWRRSPTRVARARATRTAIPSATARSRRPSARPSASSRRMAAASSSCSAAAQPRTASTACSSASRSPKRIS
jgi:hypothetical protein